MAIGNPATMIYHEIDWKMPNSNPGREHPTRMLSPPSNLQQIVFGAKSVSVRILYKIFVNTHLLQIVDERLMLIQICNIQQMHSKIFSEEFRCC